MKRFLTSALVCSAVAAGIFLLSQGSAEAGTMSGVCSKCHTMHNSQDGAKMTTGTTLAQDYLLRVAGCLGCHSDDPGTAVSSLYSAPIVLHLNSAPLYDPRTNNGETLAGGSFYWVDNDGGNAGDDKGHNVSSVVAADTTLSEPPGVETGTAFEGSNDIDCGDCHLGGAHHYNEGGDYATNTDGWANGSSPGASYRFLSGRIQGGEDADWEWTYGSADHNIYFSAGTTALGDVATDTFQYHCALCHGNFHGTYSDANDTGAGAASPWKRHPTDFKLSAATGTEYAAYQTYEVESPVGSTDTGITTTFSAVSDPDNVVVCTSCHRAHGSPYADMLRWTYDMDAGTNTGRGCFVCHTTK